MSNELSTGEAAPRAADDDLVSTAIVRAVAAAEGVGPLELQPLAETIDTDALDRIVDSLPDDGDRPAYLEFPYEGHVITVNGDGRFTVEPFDR